MLEVIKKRRSYRQFLDKPVEDEKINEILKAIMYSPSGHHKRLWELIVVRDAETRR
jgi:nitroreductase